MSPHGTKKASSHYQDEAKISCYHLISHMDSHPYGSESHHHDLRRYNVHQLRCSLLSFLFGAKLRDVFAKTVPRAFHQPAALCLGFKSRYFFSSPLVSFILRQIIGAISGFVKPCKHNSNRQEHILQYQRQRFYPPILQLFCSILTILFSSLPFLPHFPIFSATFLPQLSDNSSHFLFFLDNMCKNITLGVTLPRYNVITINLSTTIFSAEGANL